MAEDSTRTTLSPWRQLSKEGVINNRRRPPHTPRHLSSPVSDHTKRWPVVIIPGLLQNNLQKNTRTESRRLSPTPRTLWIFSVLREALSLSRPDTILQPLPFSYSLLSRSHSGSLLLLLLCCMLLLMPVRHAVCVCLSCSAVTLLC